MVQTLVPSSTISPSAPLPPSQNKPTITYKVGLVYLGQKEGVFPLACGTLLPDRVLQRSSSPNRSFSFHPSPLGRSHMPPRFPMFHPFYLSPFHSSAPISNKPMPYVPPMEARNLLLFNAELHCMPSAPFSPFEGPQSNSFHILIGARQCIGARRREAQGENDDG